VVAIVEGNRVTDIHFGLTGLAVMGQNLARNVAHKGFPIVVHNRTTEKTENLSKSTGTRVNWWGRRLLPTS